MNFTKKYLISLSVVVLIIILGRIIVPKSSALRTNDFSKTSQVSANSSTIAPASTGASAPSTTAPTSSPSQSSSSTSSNSGQYKNGNYNGSVEDAVYGNIQVKVTISGGKITTVSILQYPNENGTSSRINQQAIPQLQREVISAQSTNINGVSGASFTSQAFYNSVKSALDQAA